MEILDYETLIFVEMIVFFASIRSLVRFFSYWETFFQIQIFFPIFFAFFSLFSFRFCFFFFFFHEKKQFFSLPSMVSFHWARYFVWIERLIADFGQKYFTWVQVALEQSNGNKFPRISCLWIFDASRTRLNWSSISPPTTVKSIRSWMFDLYSQVSTFLQFSLSRNENPHCSFFSVFIFIPFECWDVLMVFNDQLSVFIIDFLDLLLTNWKKKPKPQKIEWTNHENNNFLIVNCKNNEMWICPGTRIGQASECFIYWKDTMTNDTWGLNFTSPIDAKQFKECCVSKKCSTPLIKAECWRKNTLEI